MIVRSMLRVSHPNSCVVSVQMVGCPDLQLTHLDGQVEILENYQKYCNIFPHMINFEVLL